MRRLILAFLPTCLIGCAAPPDCEVLVSPHPRPLIIEPEPCTDDGISSPVCGFLPNGPDINGTDLQGGTVASVDYRGMTDAAGQQVDGARVERGALVTSRQGAPVAPVGLRLKATRLGPRGDRRPIELRVQAVHHDLAFPTYELVYRELDRREHAQCVVWRPVCPLASEGGATAATLPRAMLLDALWSYEHGEMGDGGRIASTDQFSVSCLGTGAIAKCAELGYLPWDRRPGCEAEDEAGCDLAAHHEACVRALRADFCGNGFPLTDPNVPINVYDTLEIRKDGPGKGEASWNPAGSVCISETRLAATLRRSQSSVVVLDYVNGVCPGRFTAAGREPWGGLCRDVTLRDADQIFTEFLPAAP